MTEKQKKQVVSEFLNEQLDIISGQQVLATSTDSMNLVDLHFLTGLQMGVHFLITKIDESKKLKTRKPTTEA